MKEQLEKFGVPVLVERSSYESDPLARMEWVKLYGILLGRTEEAERIFDDAVQRIAPLLDEEPTGKTAAFFSITSNNLATVRKGGDYVAKMIGLAGGSYVFADLTDSGNNLATVNISLEDFYAGARDADVLFYNSTIEGELRTMDEAARQMSDAGGLQGRAKRQRLVYVAEPFPAEHGAAGADPGYEQGVHRG